MAIENIQPSSRVPASAAITANYFVKESASGIVACSVAGENAIGVAMEPSAANDTRAIPVALISRGGTMEVKTSGLIAVGGAVATHSDGTARAATGNTTRVLGYARTASTAGGGEVIEVDLGSSGFAANA